MVNQVFSNPPAALLDRYAQEIKSLELQKEQLVRALASKSIAHAKPAAHPSAPMSKTERMIQELKQQKQQLERELASSPTHAHTEQAVTFVEPSAAARARQAAAARKASLDRLLREKAALKKEIVSYAKTKDPLVEGVLSQFDTSTDRGLLSRVGESEQNVLGSLATAAASSGAARERQALLEAEATGDVTPREAFAQRVIAIGDALRRRRAGGAAGGAADESALRGPSEAAAAVHARGDGTAAAVVAAAAAARRPEDTVRRLQLALAAAERVAAIKRQLQRARRDLAVIAAAPAVAGQTLADADAAGGADDAAPPADAAAAPEEGPAAEAAAAGPAEAEGGDAEGQAAEEGAEAAPAAAAAAAAAPTAPAEEGVNPEAEFQSFKKAARAWVGFSGNLHSAAAAVNETLCDPLSDKRFRKECHAIGYTPASITVGAPDFTGPDRFGRQGAGPQMMIGKLGDNLIGVGTLGAAGSDGDDNMLPAALTLVSGITNKDPANYRFGLLAPSASKELMDGSALTTYGKAFGALDDEVPAEAVHPTQY